MSPVEMQAIQGSLILRARGSELLILAHHISELKSLKQPKDFTRYFMNDALINRPARKLFEAWLRKDGTLWQRLYTMVQKEMEASESETPVVKKTVIAKAPTKETKADEPKAAKTEKAPTKAAKAEPEKKVAKEEKVKETAAAPAKKVAAKKEEKKTTAAKAKPAAKEKPAAAKKVTTAKKKTTTAAKKNTTAAKSAGKSTKKKK